MENKQTNQPSEIQGTKTHRQEYYKSFGDHDGVLSKLSFRSKQQNVFWSWLSSSRPSYIFCHQINIPVWNPSKDLSSPPSLSPFLIPTFLCCCITVCVLHSHRLLFELVILFLQQLFAYACFLECWISILCLK